MNRIRKMNRPTRHWSVFAVCVLLACSLSGCVRSMLQARLPESTDEDRPVTESISTAQLRNPADLKPSEGAQACLTTADSLAAKGHEVEAVKLLLRARQLDPKQKHLAHRLAVLYDRQGNDKLAMEEYKKALTESPSNAELLNDFGYFYYQRGQWAEAERFFQNALAVSPEHQRVRTNLALTMAKQGKYEESLEMFTSAVGPAAAHSNLGILYAQAGRIEDAKRELKRALSIDPHLSQANAMLAHLQGNAMQTVAQ